MIEPLTLIYLSFGAIFIFCNCGENLTSRFNELSDAIYECEWHLFPNNIQRVLPIIMNSAQKAIILRGFGNVSCTREAFKEVSIHLIIFMMCIPTCFITIVLFFLYPPFLN